MVSASSTSFLRTTRLSFSNDGVDKFGADEKLLTEVQLFGECGCRDNWRKRANCFSDSFTCDQKLVISETWRKLWMVSQTNVSQRVTHFSRLAEITNRFEWYFCQVRWVEIVVYYLALKCAYLWLKCKIRRYNRSAKSVEKYWYLHNPIWNHRRRLCFWSSKTFYPGNNEYGLEVSNMQTLVAESHVLTSLYFSRHGSFFSRFWIRDHKTSWATSIEIVMTWIKMQGLANAEGESHTHTNKNARVCSALWALCLKLPRCRLFLIL